MRDEVSGNVMVKPALENGEAEARLLQRFKVDSECKIKTDSGAFSGKLADLSPIGARVLTDASVEIDDTVTLAVPSVGSVKGRVARVEDGAFALEFPMDAASVAFVFKTITEPMRSEWPKANKPAPKEGAEASDATTEEAQS